MNPFTEHPRRQGVTYQAHPLFATGIALRLLNSVIAFTLHAIFPCIGIKRSLDLESTTAFLRGRNAWIESMKSDAAQVHAGNSSGLLQEHMR